MELYLTIGALVWYAFGFCSRPSTQLETSVMFLRGDVLLALALLFQVVRQTKK